jgi:hypothetical protein
LKVSNNCDYTLNVQNFNFSFLIAIFSFSGFLLLLFIVFSSCFIYFCHFKNIFFKKIDNEKMVELVDVDENID